MPATSLSDSSSGSRAEQMLYFTSELGLNRATALILQRAERLQEKGQLKQALHYFKKVLLEYPDCDEASVNVRLIEEAQASHQTLGIVEEGAPLAATPMMPADRVPTVVEIHCDWKRIVVPEIQVKTPDQLALEAAHRMLRENGLDVAQLSVVEHVAFEEFKSEEDQGTLWWLGVTKFEAVYDCEVKAVDINVPWELQVSDFRFEMFPPLADEFALRFARSKLKSTDCDTCLLEIIENESMSSHQNAAWDTIWKGVAIIRAIYTENQACPSAAVKLSALGSLVPSTPISTDELNNQSQLASTGAHRESHSVSTGTNGDHAASDVISTSLSSVIGVVPASASNVHTLRAASENLTADADGEPGCIEHADSSDIYEEILCDAAPNNQTLDANDSFSNRSMLAPPVNARPSEVASEKLFSKLYRIAGYVCCVRRRRPGNYELMSHDFSFMQSVCPTSKRSLSGRTDSSDASCIILSSDAMRSGKKRCFVPGTLFKTISGQFVPVHQLQEQSIVCGSIGEPLRVVAITKHAPEDQALVSLRTVHAHHLVTADHSVFMDAGKSVEAAALQIGDLVHCSNGQQPLLNVKTFRCKLEVYEIVFHPNSPVVSFLEPDDIILTKGGVRASNSPTRWTKTRRGGMARRRKSQNAIYDAVSIPDTDNSW